MVAAKDGKPHPTGLGTGRRRRTDHRSARPACWARCCPSALSAVPRARCWRLVVELLVTAVIGAQFGFEASSFFVDEGNQPRIGQAFIVIDPGALAGTDRVLRPHGNR
ncbi:MAG: hypothetical protein V9G09_09960 [Candidatus Nanopelagicales bacterium]